MPLSKLLKKPTSFSAHMAWGCVIALSVGPTIGPLPALYLTGFVGVAWEAIPAGITRDSWRARFWDFPSWPLGGLLAWGIRSLLPCG
jgi:hypothetical protein